MAAPPLRDISTTVDTLTDVSTAVRYLHHETDPDDRRGVLPSGHGCPLGEAEADRLAAVLRVLADPARLRLLSIIGADPDGKACVCDLTEPVGLSEPTVSHHLKVLADAGLVGREQRGRWVYYSIRPEPLELLRGALAAPIRTTVDPVRS